MRERFINLVNSGGLPFSQVCERFGISRKTGYKWLNRFRAEGPAGLIERDRVPRSHPQRTGAEIEALVAEIHAAEPTWKGGSIRTALRERGVEPLPAVTTIDAICRRCDEARVGGGGGATRRAAPNDVWQLELGPVSPTGGVHHGAILVRDAATDFVLAAEVVARRGEEGCRKVLWEAFARQGLPRRLRWPVADEPGDLGHHTPLSVALLKLGIGVEFYVAAPRPAATAEAWAELQTRLGATGEGSEVRARLRAVGSAELGEFRGGVTLDLARRPHEALTRWRGRLAAWADRHNLPSSATVGSSAPATRYRPSPRQLTAAGGAFRPTGSGAETRRVSEKGIVHLGGCRWVIGRAFAGETVTVRVLPNEEGIAVDFGGWPLGIAPFAETAAGGEWAFRLGSMD